MVFGLSFGLEGEVFCLRRSALIVLEACLGRVIPPRFMFA